ncbi:DUF6777 domain-containing protein [Streptomyces lunaelactis]|uniref:DUF6777 domain-containing protein n=1 Tax=Streptomyces lunaelactis TaxID=1535768 RepID=UPI001C300478|nr:DUF6777 domain-containing protein [Streptomyces lunaelactis]
MIGVVSLIVSGFLFFQARQGQEQEGEILLQPAAEAGPDPFTSSVAAGSPTPTATGGAQSPPADTGGGTVLASRRGGEPGLFGGTRTVSQCDSRRMVGFLAQNPTKGQAWAGTLGFTPADIPRYVATLTPVLLVTDTRVTNHSFRDARAVPYQAVLQTGTAVLVDRYGVPRVRCACGNPLIPMVPQQGTPKPTGDSWPGFRQSNVVVVRPSVTVINVFIVYDPTNGDWFSRQRGDEGADDEKTEPPPNVIKPPPCAPQPADGTPTPAPGGTSSPCPPTSPSSKAPSSKTPSSEPPPSDSSEPPPSDPSTPSQPASPDGSPESASGSTSAPAPDSA